MVMDNIFHYHSITNFPVLQLRSGTEIFTWIGKSDYALNDREVISARNKYHQKESMLKENVLYP